MIILIHITEKQTGKILDYIPIGDFWDDNHHKSLKDTLEYFEFRTFGDKRYSQYLEKMNRIIIPDEDGTFIEFVIFHAIKYRLQNTVVVDVYAPASYLLLKKAKVIKPQKLEGYTAAQHADFALAGTEWEVGRVDYAGIRTITIESHTNPYAYLKRIASVFDLELHFRVEVDGNKVIGRYVDLLERVGEWQGREVEFGRDLLGIERKVDDSNVVTALIGLGPERDDGTRLEVFVEDKEALQRWGIPNPQTGELTHLIETYEPESTDQNMSIERLTELTRNELEKRINSVVEYTADVADLEKVPGMENKVIRFGDTIKIKDTGFNPPLYLEARVHTQDRSLSQSEKKKVTLGDFIEYTEEEVHAIWKQLQAEIAKKVSMAQVTEVVYTKPEVDARDDAVREHADTVAENAKIEAIQIAAEDASQKAKQAEDNAKGYTDDRLLNTVAKDIFESTVTDILNNIAQKVDSTRFEQVESELRGIAEGLQREIEEHAEALEEHGGKITKLETDVDEVEGKISTTIAELQSLEETVSRHETQIEANAREIALKADKQELDLLSGTVSDISSELSVMAGKIEAKAERSEVEKLESDVSKVSQDVSKLTIDVDGIKTNVGSISQTVSNHGTQISNINSTLTQHADMIATKVEKSEFDSVTNTLGNRISTIEQTADSISLEVSDIKANVYTKSEVDSAIDGIQVGGRNLIPNTSDKNKTVSWSGWDYRLILVPSIEDVGLSVGDTVVFRVYIEETNAPVKSFVEFILNDGDRLRYIQKDGNVIYEGESGWSEVRFTISEEDVRDLHQFKVAIRNENNSSATVTYRKAKMELGNKATDWTPAPEDIDAQIDDIEGTLASHSTKIEQNAQQIQLRATKAEVDTLEGRIQTVESDIKQTAENVTFTFRRLDEIDGVLNSAVTTIDETGVTVKDGSFYLEDKNSSMKYSIVPKTNIVEDGSFETVLPARDNVGTYGFEISEAFFEMVGKPKLETDLVRSDAGTGARFGHQALVVNNSNYPRVIVHYFDQDTEYTVTAYFARHWNASGNNYPRIVVNACYDDPNLPDPRVVAKTDTFTSTTPVKSNGEYIRVGFTFRTPKGSQWGTVGTWLEISLLGTNSNWMLVDGLQVVEGNQPTQFEPENALWNFANGITPVRSIRIEKADFGNFITFHRVDSYPSLSGFWELGFPDGNFTLGSDGLGSGDNDNRVFQIRKDGTIYIKNEVITNKKEKGFCGVGGIRARDTSSTMSFAGVGVNFRKRKTYTPSSIAFTTHSSSNVANNRPVVFVITEDGFYMALDQDTRDYQYGYWRGWYEA